MVEGALTSREHQRGNGTLPATKPKKVAESREKPNAAGLMVPIIGGIALERPSPAARYRDVRFTPESGHSASCPLYPRSGH